MGYTKLVRCDPEKVEQGECREGRHTVPWCTSTRVSLWTMLRGNARRMGSSLPRFHSTSGKMQLLYSTVLDTCKLQTSISSPHQVVFDTRVCRVGRSILRATRARNTTPRSCLFYATNLVTQAVANGGVQPQALARRTYRDCVKIFKVRSAAHKILYQYKGPDHSFF